MGMFDYIKNELFCPFCGKKITPNSFQTKDFRNGMFELDIKKIKGVYFSIHSNCPHCKRWIDLHINPDYED